MKESLNIAFMLLNLALFIVVVGLNIKSMIESNKEEKGEVNYYKHITTVFCIDYLCGSFYCCG